MSFVQNYLSSRLPIVGLAAYMLRASDTVIESQCLSKSVYPSSTNEMLVRVVNVGFELLSPGESPAQYCWTFESHRVYVASRPDGFSLALLVENNPGVQLFRVQETLQGFLELTES